MLEENESSLTSVIFKTLISTFFLNHNLIQNPVYKSYKNRVALFIRD